MTPNLRKFALTAHITFSVGWLGAVVAYLALAIAGLTSQDAQMVRSAYLAMELIGWFVIVPCSIAALLTGLVQALGTEWGLFRHYWILAKFLLAGVGTIILLLHMPAVSRMSRAAAESRLFSGDFGAPRIQLAVHAGGGLLVLFAATTLSVYKPWGLTLYGRRKVSQAIPAQRLTTTGNAADTHMTDVPSHAGSSNDAGARPDRRSSTNTAWKLYVLLAIIGLILLLFVLLHLSGGGLRRH